MSPFVALGTATPQHTLQILGVRLAVFFPFSIALGLELSDTKVYDPEIRAILETASHFCKHGWLLVASLLGAAAPIYLPIYLSIYLSIYIYMYIFIYIYAYKYFFIIPLLPLCGVIFPLRGAMTWMWTMSPSIALGTATDICRRVQDSGFNPGFGLNQDSGFQPGFRI